ncbi:MAG TPA: hypothetical protein PLB21_00920 [Actinomycetota bacterium]|nr:hypothetical protein [Actinomycetota bacterium]
MKATTTASNQIKALLVGADQILVASLLQLATRFTLVRTELAEATVQQQGSHERACEPSVVDTD